MTYFATMPSPIGELTLCSNGEALTGLYFSTAAKHGVRTRRGGAMMLAWRQLLPNYGVLCGPTQRV